MSHFDLLSAMNRQRFEDLKAFASDPVLRARYLRRYILSLDRMTRYLTRAPLRSRPFSLWFVRSLAHGLSDAAAALVDRWVEEDGK